MVKYYGFRNVQPGDTIRLSNPNRDDLGIDDVIFTVTSKYNSHNFGPIIHGRVNDEDESFYEYDDWEIEVIKFARGLPHTAYFTWNDENGNRHIAVQNADKTWNADGVQLTAQELYEQVKKYELIPLSTVS